jgi:hypothetical protein
MIKLPLLALVLAIATGCSGGGQTVAASGPHSCPPFLGGSVQVPALQPPNGATGISPSIGSIVVPFEDGLAGQMAVLLPSPPGSNAAAVAASPFTPSGTTLVATIPTLAAHTTYTISADVLISAGTGPLGCDVRRSYLFGSFTTQ